VDIFSGRNIWMDLLIEEFGILISIIIFIWVLIAASVFEKDDDGIHKYSIETRSAFKKFYFLIGSGWLLLIFSSNNIISVLLMILISIIIGKSIVLSSEDRDRQDFQRAVNKMKMSTKRKRKVTSKFKGVNVKSGRRVYYRTKGELERAIKSGLTLSVADYEKERLKNLPYDKIE
tara:strand:- start:826 stop:1350 length:525 start_codon:yes stop_codon:yes gene_type:complete